MVFAREPSPPRFLAPEVVQTSTMDCGPAPLKCLLEGFGIPAHYGRLREACQTDVDGTSIDAIEDVAVQLGLHAEQSMVPRDHMLLPESHSLPALVVTRQPNGLTHFVVVWSCHGPFVQVMDPAIGRRWPSRKRFLNDVYRHSLPLSAAVLRAWASSTDFAAPLHQRLMRLGIAPRECDRLIDIAREDAGWRAFAALDAAAGLVTTVVEARGLRRGAEAGALVRRYIEPARLDAPDAIPDVFWSVRPLPRAPGADGATEERLMLRGAVLVRVHGRHPTSPPQSSQPQSEVSFEETGPTTAQPAGPAAVLAATATQRDDGPPPPLSPDLAAALEETPSQPEREIWQALRADGLLTPAVLMLALALAALGVTGEAVLFRGLMELGKHLGFEGLRFQLIVAVCLLMALLLLLELPMGAAVLRLGRRLEMRLRLAFLDKIPRLGEHYFHCRLTSDMAQRAHDLRQFRTIPILGSRVLRTACQLLLTTAGIIWLAPANAPIAVLALLWAMGLSILVHPVLAERDMRVRTHIGALSRFYLDACLGLAPVRTHGAERALRREHENLLVEWARASLAVSHLGVATQSVSALISSGGGF
jgi:ATP-binding cassette subfamily B protein